MYDYDIYIFFNNKINKEKLYKFHASFQLKIDDIIVDCYSCNRSLQLHRSRTCKTLLSTLYS